MLLRRGGGVGNGRKLRWNESSFTPGSGSGSDQVLTWWPPTGTPRWPPRPASAPGWPGGFRGENVCRTCLAPFSPAPKSPWVVAIWKHTVGTSSPLRPVPAGDTAGGVGVGGGSGVRQGASARARPCSGTSRALPLLVVALPPLQASGGPFICYPTLRQAWLLSILQRCGKI